jgi:hypothetical protein
MPGEAELPLCFVVGPIGPLGSVVRKQADTLFEYVVVPALGDRYRIDRADKEQKAGQITAQIMLSLDRADLIVADLSGLNPNALYELGIAHALGRRVIHVTNDFAMLPFDLKDARCLLFDALDPSNHRHLVDQVREMDTLTAAERPASNPFTVAVAPKASIVGSDEVIATTLADVMRRLGALEREMTTIRSGEDTSVDSSREDEKALVEQALRILENRGVRVRGIVRRGPRSFVVGLDSHDMGSFPLFIGDYVFDKD